jgi:hypothetical protein
VFENAVYSFFANTGAVQVLTGELLCLMAEIAVFTTVAISSQEELAKVLSQVYRLLLNFALKLSVSFFCHIMCVKKLLINLRNLDLYKFRSFLLILS